MTIKERELVKILVGNVERLGVSLDSMFNIKFTPSMDAVDNTTLLLALIDVTDLLQLYSTYKNLDLEASKRERDDYLAMLVKSEKEGNEDGN